MAKRINILYEAISRRNGATAKAKIMVDVNNVNRSPEQGKQGSGIEERLN